MTSYIGQETGNQFGMGVYPPTRIIFQNSSERETANEVSLVTFHEALNTMIGLAIVCGMRCVPLSQSNRWASSQIPAMPACTKPRPEPA